MAIWQYENHEIHMETPPPGRNTVSESAFMVQLVREKIEGQGSLAPLDLFGGVRACKCQVALQT
jgi:hypothetical protein